MAKNTIGRTPEVSDELIIEVGNKLMEEGRRITGFALRKAVGNKGDSQRLLKVWLANLSTQGVIPDNKQRALPVELEETLNSVVNETTEKLKSLALELNQAAVTTAEQRVAAAVELANDREQAAEAEVHDAALTIDDLEKQLTTISLEYAQCQQALQLSKQETQHQLKLAGEFNFEVSTLVTQLSAHEQKNIDLIQSAEIDKNNNNELITEIAELKAEKSELREENKRLAIEVSKLSNVREKKLSALITQLENDNNDAA